MWYWTKFELFLSENVSFRHCLAKSQQGSTSRLKPPFLVFTIAFVVSLPLRISVLQDYGGAHPLVMDFLRNCTPFGSVTSSKVCTSQVFVAHLAEMSEAQMQMRLTPPPPVRRNIPAVGKEETAGMSPRD